MIIKRRRAGWGQKLRERIERPSYLYTVSQRIADIIDRSRERLGRFMDKREVEWHIAALFKELRDYSSSDLVLNKEKELDREEVNWMLKSLERLEADEPLQYVLGYEAFHGLELKTDQRALIPRPETEELVQRIVSAFEGPPEKVLDLGTGNGCIALALKKAFPDAEVHGADLSEEALSLARENALRKASELYLHYDDMTLSASDGSFTFDLIVSNPPYVLPEEAEGLAERVRNYEPDMALYAAQGDGLEAYRSILQCLGERGSDEAQLWVEVHPDQASAVKELFEKSGCRRTEILEDLSGKSRFVKALRPSKKGSE